MGVLRSAQEPLAVLANPANFIRPFILLVLAFYTFRNYDWFIGAVPETSVGSDEKPLQDIVTWDEHSLYIKGERVMIMSGEFHPWRLPVPSLWLDIFQKVKAMGFNCVSFYSNWALLEGKPGNFSAEGVFAYEEFFKAATKAGVYLIARPGPYINAEVSFGGFPGWLQRIKGHLRTPDEGYLAATDNYATQIGAIIARAQITNGGPVILYQPENEYTVGVSIPFPSGNYMQYVEDQAKNAGVVVPLISNDAVALGRNAPGTGLGEVEIYGHDAYPVMFDCANPSTWPLLALSGTYHQIHELQSPLTPFSLVEFQGGAYDPWGGPGFNNCATFINHEFERVFFKNNFAAGVAIHNIYMIYGGTNWGNIGHPGGYTSYDYGAAISEDRTIVREKYSELKLEAEWLKVSPDYLTAQPGAALVWTYATNAAITVTRLAGNSTLGSGSFFVVRHSDYSSTTSDSYTMKLPTSEGDISIPTLFDKFTLHGRDSKIIVTDYDVQGIKLLYSTAEILTHQRFQNATVLLVYSGPTEINELAVKTTGGSLVVSDDSIKINRTEGLVTLAWATSPTRRVVQIDRFHIYILDRNSAYKYWIPEISKSLSLIINGPYLVRSASLENGALSVSADFNRSTIFEVIGAPQNTTTLIINGKKVDFENQDERIVATIPYSAPLLNIPLLSELPWIYVDSLPEIQTNYDDSTWVICDHQSTNNSYQILQTPTSLFAGDYGFHAGILLFRGHFTAKGTEKSFKIKTQGGTAYGHSIWLNGIFLGSWVGSARNSNYDTTYELPDLTQGESYTFTIVIDHMGLDGNYVPGIDTGKAPRGILNYRLTSSLIDSTPITWKITGNFGGEDYVDQVRGPLNEGGLYIERQGYHQPRPPTQNFTSGSPFSPPGKPGISYYMAPLSLDLPSDTYDIPLSFSFRNVDGGAARIQLYVNGWQFGKFVGHIGPQTNFPVPEGILNYNGENWIGLAIWRMEENGREPVLEFTLEAGIPVLTGRDPVVLVESPIWSLREGAY
ncbi:glycoside hydrolase family 35 protein [Annulohypoxylon maeteangense]|uniref:glycoside hydrolase family 35 protein n=1 Tax=Annulohypoxylon maeteangense TaxID=1927788 RepID=UPI002007C92A|nr:glycoside hydrolase family 35 protein [Annulohypoxylon maeteangense]KAI0885950.1 glycoside hydrolase family 35 protein [Annulohypoxylon maeteangense]